MSEMTSSGAAKVTLPTDEQILITREFDAPRHLLYRAWTTPELVMRWWAGQRGEMKIADIDLRVGGTWRYVMVANGGYEVAFHGEYREIVPNERIVTTEVYEGAEAVPGAEDVTNVITFTDESAPRAVEIADRPSFLVTQVNNDPLPIIERLAGAPRLTFVVGAGASMEAGLPSWGRLVRNLLESAAPATLDESDRAARLDAAAESGLLGMAATARALAGRDEEFVRRVERHLYRGKGPEHFDPGPLAREIAAWKRDYPQIQLATFNYDQLLERALEDFGLRAEAREDGERERDGVAFVRHLHGRLTGTPASDAVILTEGDYATWRTGSWQDELMRDALEGVCVFLGLSFTD